MNWVTIEMTTADTNHRNYLRVLRDMLEIKNPVDTFRIHEAAGQLALQIRI